MDNLRAKKLIVCILVALACLTVFVPIGTAYASAPKTYALHNGTPVYSDTTLTVVTARLKQNQEVTVEQEVTIGDNNYYLITADGVRGYVNALYIYRGADAPTYTVSAQKIISDKVGRPVNVYAAPDASSQVIEEITDGTQVNVINTDTDFYIIVLEDKTGYVSKSNVTEGLSRNQTVALIVGVVTVAAVIAILALLYYRRNKEHFSRKKSQ